MSKQQTKKQLSESLKVSKTGNLLEIPTDQIRRTFQGRNRLVVAWYLIRMGIVNYRINKHFKKLRRLDRKFTRDKSTFDKLSRIILNKEK